MSCQRYYREYLEKSRYTMRTNKHRSVIFPESFWEANGKRYHVKIYLYSNRMKTRLVLHNDDMKFDESI